ncbi:MAG: hypothetical protein SNG49_05720 [Rikenellaceae bacterium]
MRTLLSLLILIALSACATTKLLNTSAKDSLRIETIERKVVIYDTIHIDLPHIIERTAIRQDSSILTNQLARSEAIVRPDGVLYHSLELIAQRIDYPTQTLAEVRDSIIYKERVVTQTIERERELSGWQRTQISGFWILLALLLVAIVVAILFR